MPGVVLGQNEHNMDVTDTYIEKLVADPVSSIHRPHPCATRSWPGSTTLSALAVGDDRPGSESTAL
jgi:hypothetical protein